MGSTDSTSAERDSPVPLWNRLLAPALREQAKKVWLWLAVGLVVRVVLLPWFASVDLLSNIYVTSVLVDHHQLLNTTADPPPIFFLNGGLDFLVRPWISSQIGSVFSGGASFTPDYEPQALAANMPGINLLIAVLKVPYLVADLAIAFLLPRFFNDSRAAFVALLLWWFNPISIFVSYMVGQYDIIATAFVLGAFYALRTDRKVACTAALGFAIIFEVFAILLVPFILIYWVRTSRGWVSRAWAGFQAVLGPFLAVAGLATIYRFQPTYYEPANVAVGGRLVNGYYGSLLYSRGEVTHLSLSGLWTWIGYSSQFPISTDLSDVILLVVVAYGLLVFAVYSARELTWDHIWAASLATFLVIYGLSGFVVQWVLWSLPFLILLLTKDLRRHILPYLVFLSGYFVYVCYFGAALTGTLLQVSYPPAVAFNPITWLDDLGLNGPEVLNIGRSLFSAACLWFLFLTLREPFFSRFWPASNPVAPRTPG